MTMANGKDESNIDDLESLMVGFMLIMIHMMEIMVAACWWETR